MNLLAFVNQFVVIQILSNICPEVSYFLSSYIICHFTVAVIMQNIYPLVTCFNWVYLILFHAD
jgi:hypothetical protein